MEVGFQEIRNIFHINADNSKEEIDEFVEFIENTCPVGVTIKNATKMVSTVEVE